MSAESKEGLIELDDSPLPKIRPNFNNNLNTYKKPSNKQSPFSVSNKIVVGNDNKEKPMASSNNSKRQTTKNNQNKGNKKKNKVKSQSNNELAPIRIQSTLFIKGRDYLQSLKNNIYLL